MNDMLYDEQELILLESELRLHEKKLLTGYIRMMFSPLYGLHRNYYNISKGWIFPVLLWGAVLISIFFKNDISSAISMILLMMFFVLLIADFLRIDRWHQQEQQCLKNKLIQEIINDRDNRKVTPLQRALINDEVVKEVGHLETGYAYAHKLSFIYGFHRKYLNLSGGWMYPLLFFMSMILINYEFTIIEPYQVIGIMLIQPLVLFMGPYIIAAYGSVYSITLIGGVILTLVGVLLLVDVYRLDDIIYHQKLSLQEKKLSRT